MTVRSVTVNLTANTAAYQAAMARAAQSTTAVGTAAQQASSRAAAANLAHQRATLQLTQTQASAGRQLAAAQNNLATAQARHLQAVQTGSRVEQAATRQQVALQRAALQQVQASTSAQLNSSRATLASAHQAQLITQQQTAQQQALQQAHARTAAAIQGTGLALGAVGAALVGVVAVGVNKAAEFEQAMSHVEAATHASSLEMGQLRQAALDAGARTVYTATQSAGAIEEMAKAGVKTADILNGGLNGALSLAAAGTLDVGQAAELASSTMVQFGLKGDQVSHIADVMAASAGKAQGSVQDVGTAMSYVGPVAAQMGISMEETAGAITLLSNNGILAEKAGTGLRGMLLSLTSPSAKAAQEMQNLGINVFGNDGKFIGLAATAQVLKDRLGGLSESERDAALGIIFSNAQMPAAISLMTGGAKAVNGFTKEVNDQGYASETARLKLDNLRGDVEKLGGALDTAFIQGGSGSLAPLRKVVEGVTSVVNAYSKLPAASQTALLAITGVTGAMALASGAFLLAGPRIVATRAAMATLSTQAPRTTAGLIGLGKAAGTLAALTLAATAIGAIAGANEKAAPGINAMTQALDGLGAGSDRALNSLFKGETGVNGFTESLRQLTDPSLRAKVNDFLGHLVGQGDLGMETARKQISSLDQALTAMVQGGNAPQAAAAFQELARRANAAGVSTDKLSSLLPGYTDAVKGAGNASQLTAQDQSALKRATDAATTAMENAKNVVDDLKNALDDLIGVNLSADQANIAFQQSLDDMTKKLKESAKAAHGHTLTLNENTQAGRDNRTAVISVISALSDKLNADAKAGKSANALQRDLEDGTKALTDQAVHAGLTRKQIKDLATQYGLTPKVVETLVRAIGTDTAKSDILAVQRSIDRLTGKTIEIKVSAATLASIRDLTGNSNISAGQAASNITRNRAGGGYISGPGGPTDDVIPAMLSNGEYVVRASAVRALGVEYLDSLNKYANGGLVTINEQGPSSAQRTAMSNTVQGQVAAIADAVGASIGRKVSAAVGQLGAGLQGALRWARGEAGKPYIWGGVGPAGYDCSGFMSAIANYITKQPIHQRRFATASFAGGGGAGGMVPGYGRPGGFSIGVMQGNPGHTAGTLAGVNVESRGGQGVVVGPSARGASNSLFSQRFHLKGYAQGGAVGDAAFDYLDPRGKRHAQYLALLSNGEYVINPRSAARIGYGNLDMLNRYAGGGLVRRKYASGGRVTTTNPHRGTAEDDMPARSPGGGRLTAYAHGVGTYSDGYTYSAHGWAKPAWHALPGNVPALPPANASPAAVDRTIAAMDAYVKRWQEANRAADEHAARLKIVHDLNAANAAVARAEAAASNTRTANEKAAQRALDKATAERKKAEADSRHAQDTKGSADNKRARDELAKARDDVTTAKKRLATAQNANKNAAQARADLAQAKRDQAQAAGDLAAFDAQSRRDARQRALDARQEQLQRQRDAAQRRADAAAAQAQARLDRTNQLSGVDYTARQLPTPAPSISAVLLNARDAVAQIIEWSRDLATLRKRGLSNTAIAALKLEDGPQMLGLERQLLRGTDAEIRQLSSLIWRQRVLAGQSAAGHRLADGGWVSGPGGPREDRVPAMLSAGEFVVNAAAAARFGAQLERINRPKFADGGRVSAPQWSQRIDVAAPPVDTWALQMEMRRTREAVDRQTAALTQRATVVAVAGGVV